LPESYGSPAEGVCPMTLLEIEKWLKDNGYFLKRGRWYSVDQKSRYAFNTSSLRHEVRGKDGWKRVSVVPFRKLYVDKDYCLMSED
jgi:hypothetical protein